MDAWTHAKGLMPVPGALDVKGHSQLKIGQQSVFDFVPDISDCLYSSSGPSVPMYCFAFIEDPLILPESLPLERIFPLGETVIS